jgi:hypothetical protein
VATGNIYFKIKDEGKLTVRPECKGYPLYVTLYAISALMTNLTNDYVPSEYVNFDCCFENLKYVKFEQLPLRVPLVNIMSYIHDLRIPSMKAEAVQQLIKEQELKNSQSLYVVSTSWGTAFGMICLLIICIRCSCCKCCRSGFFWLCDKWTPKDC